MKTTWRFLLVLLLLVGLSVGLAACSDEGDDDDTADDDDDDDTADDDDDDDDNTNGRCSISIQPGQVCGSYVEAFEDDFTNGDDSQLPDYFPALPEGDIELCGSITTLGAYQVVYVVGELLDDLAAYYEPALESAGYTILDVTDDSETCSMTVNFEKDGAYGSVNYTGTNSTLMITLM